MVGRTDLMTNRQNDEKVIIYLTNRKIASNMKDNSLKMKRIRQLFLSDKITFDDAVKAIANDSFIIFDDAN